MKIEKSYKLPFAIERVYSAWTSSGTVVPPATSMDIDPVVGGHYRLIMETPHFVSRNEGKFLVVEPMARLKYTWEWNKDGNITEIDVSFEVVGDGTLVRICHSGFSDADSARQHDSGWDSYIEGFSKHLRTTATDTR